MARVDVNFRQWSPMRNADINLRRQRTRGEEASIFVRTFRAMRVLVSGPPCVMSTAIRVADKRTEKKRQEFSEWS